MHLTHTIFDIFHDFIPEYIADHLLRTYFELIFATLLDPLHLMVVILDQFFKIPFNLIKELLILNLLGPLLFTCRTLFYLFTVCVLGIFTFLCTFHCILRLIFEIALAFLVSPVIFRNSVLVSSRGALSPEGLRILFG